MTRLRLLVLLAVVCCSGAVDRYYYLASEEVDWDYAPGGSDLIIDERHHQQSSSAVFLERSAHRVGRVYKKAVYNEYTDNSFRQLKPKPDYLGFLGPILKGEQGDRIIVHYKNKASRPYTVHPHGVVYEKNSEGAIYLDDTRSRDKMDDSVAPGESHIYVWNVTDEGSPRADGPDCLTWLYHSHINPVKDTNTGLIGFLLTCKPGTLSVAANPRHHEFALLLSVIDENESWYLQDNIQKFCSDPSGVNRESEDFLESNKMHAINGYLYGTLPGLRVCAYDQITWRLAGFGNEVDLHNLAISGNSFIFRHHRRDSIQMDTAQFSTATSQANRVGKWLVSCQVNDHITAGMQAFLTVNRCNTYRFRWRWPMRMRRYYIAAEEEDWDYAPGGMNRFSGSRLVEPGSDSEIFFKRDNKHIGGVYKKALFTEYTDLSFENRKRRSPDEEHLGFLGPVIKAEVGEIIKVQFYNKASRPYSMHAHGVEFSKAFEGQLYEDASDWAKRDDYVRPGYIKTYYWPVPAEMGPTDKDPPCITRVYTSAVDVVKDTYSGLIGPMLICKRGALNAQRKQKHVDKEFFLLFSVTDENQAWYLDDNIRSKGLINVNKEDGDFMESNLLHGINGRLYGNLNGLNMCLGDRISWHVMSLGTEVDIHTVEFHGQTFTLQQSHKSATEVLPGDLKTLFMKADNPGTWAVVCRTNDHFMAGTKALMNVENCTGGSDIISRSGGGQEVVYYIQAEEVEWDYLPTGRDLIRGGNISSHDHHGNVFVKSGNTFIGSKYKKVVYQEYTDDTFTRQKQRRGSEQYLGFLGPIIKAQVGERIRVVFRNNASRPYSIHAQGVYYRKSAEGAAYGASRGSDNADDSVAPGQTFTYNWVVPPESGPGTSDPDCINYIYYSSVDPIKDSLSGLVGPLVVCRSGILNSRRNRVDVQKEFALFFGVMDENASWYLDENIQKYTNTPGSVNKEDGEFIESNKLHVINGFLYGDMSRPTMTKGEQVDWYLMSMGTEVDLHSVHFHGNDISISSELPKHDDVAQLFPGIARTVRMQPMNIGVWLVHCHVNDHINAGMETTYEVTAPLGSLGTSR